MSRAFSGLGFTAAVVLALLIIGRTVTGGACAAARFMEQHYIEIAIVLLIMDFAAVAAVLRTRVMRALPVGFKAANGAACGLAFAQNLAFLAVGFYHTVNDDADDAFLTLLGAGGFILFYIINLFITVGAIIWFCPKKWGSIMISVLATVGLLLVIFW